MHCLRGVSRGCLDEVLGFSGVSQGFPRVSGGFLHVSQGLGFHSAGFPAFPKVSERFPTRVARFLTFRTSCLHLALCFPSFRIPVRRGRLELHRDVAIGQELKALSEGEAC